MRPIGSTKDRQPIGLAEFKTLLNLTKRDKTLREITKKKFIRAFTLLRLTGCRVSEIIEFTKEDLKYMCKNSYISLNNQNKTKKTRLLRFSPAGINLLEKLDVEDVSEKLFYKNGSSHAMSTTVFTRELNKQLKKVLGDIYTTHSFRAGVATDLIRATGNPNIAKAVLGHSSLATTLGYDRPSNNDIYEGLRKIL